MKTPDTDFETVRIDANPQVKEFLDLRDHVEVLFADCNILLRKIFGQPEHKYDTDPTVDAWSVRVGDSVFLILNSIEGTQYLLVGGLKDLRQKQETCVNFLTDTYARLKLIELAEQVSSLRSARKFFKENFDLVVELFNAQYPDLPIGGFYNPTVSYYSQELREVYFRCHYDNYESERDCWEWDLSVEILKFGS